MDIWQILTIGIRRWRLTAPLAVMGIIVAWVFSGSVSPIYKAEGSLLYLPPSANIVDVSTVAAIDPASPQFDPTIDEFIETRNPFAGSIRSAVLAAELYMGSRVVEVEFDDLGLSTDFAVVSDSRNAVLYINADASSAEVAINTVNRLLEVAVEDLNARQDSFGVDPLERVTAQTVTQDELAVVDLGGRMRIRAILLILAILFAFGVAVAVEGYEDHRSGRDPYRRNLGGNGGAGGRALGSQESDRTDPDADTPFADAAPDDKSSRSRLIAAFAVGETSESMEPSQPDPSFAHGA